MVGVIFSYKTDSILLNVKNLYISIPPRKETDPEFQLVLIGVYIDELEN